MNIKIITCHYAYNYGAVLQTYALCNYLNNKGANAEVINYRPWYYRGSTTTKNAVKLFIRKVIRIPDNIKSEKVFYTFLKEHIPMTKEYKEYAGLVSDRINADLFVAGSDQIWNLNLPNGTDPAFYFDFTPANAKLISYAASLGMDSLEENQKEYLKKKVSRFTSISVREDTAKKMLQDAGLNNVETVMDPVYLLDKQEWLGLAKKPKHMPKGKYILIYAFNR